MRYTENADNKEDDPGFFSKLLLGSSKDKTNAKSLSRYRVQVKGSGSSSIVTILNAQGAVDTGATAAHIATLLVQDLQ